jgi:hypothetical protein
MKLHILFINLKIRKIIIEKRSASLYTGFFVVVVCHSKKNIAKLKIEVCNKYTILFVIIILTKKVRWFPALVVDNVPHCVM